MRFETDIKRIEELAAEREDENWEFRGYLKGWCDLSSDEIDAHFQRFFEEVSEEIDCTECANCCIKVTPLLKTGEIKILADSRGLSYSTFCEKYLVEDPEEGGFIFKTLPCPFLKDKRCIVYPSRPHECRSYPHLQKEGRIFSLTSIFENCSVCPIVYNVYELMKQELWNPEEMDEFIEFGDE